MKRISFLTGLLLFLALLTATPLSARSGFGVMAGMNLCGAAYKESSLRTADNYALFHMGILYEQRLGLGFSVQPALIYTAKGAKDIARFDCLELPLSFKWGPDLLLFRPYMEVAPFVGYVLNSGYGVEAGVGVGLGIDFNRFAISGKYNWNGAFEGWDMKPRTIMLSLAFKF